MTEPTAGHVTHMTILRAVANHYSLTVDALRFGRSGWALSRHRMLAMLLIRQRLGWSFPQLGTCFRMNHTTTRDAVRIARARIDRDPKEAADLAAIEASLKPDPALMRCCPTCGQDVDRTKQLMELRVSMDVLTRKLEEMEKQEALFRGV